jgi:hypothetical protein
MPTAPRARLAGLALAALVVAACGTAVAETPDDAVGVAGVAVSGIDPAGLLADLPNAAAPGWEVVGSGGPVPVTLEDIRSGDEQRAVQYADAGFEVGARLSLARGDGERIAVIVDRFPHAAAAHQVEDWHVSSHGMTMVDGISRVGTTAEGVMVLDDLLVRVVAVGEQAPDEGAVRGLMRAARQAANPRA